MTQTGSKGSQLHDLHLEAGAVFTELCGVQMPRHYGDPRREYEAAVTRYAVKDRSYRARLSVSGRSPVQMLHGVLTNSVPQGPSLAEGDVLAGQGVYSALLTPKGKMVTDLRVLWLGTEEEEGLLLDLPPTGKDGTLEYFRRTLPPRFATVEDRSHELGMITVVGPEAATVVSDDVLEGRVGASALEGLSPGEYRVAASSDGTSVHVVRQDGVGPSAFDLIADMESLREIWSRLTEAGGTPMGQGVWETLRIEKGRPAYGIDMDESTIPVEAGIQARAIDDGKGCYTGQEVIVRIRDRGKVNWLLRGFRLGDVPSPAAGAELFREGEEKVVGRITSAAESPAFGETIALGYVRSEVEVESEVRLGTPTGAPALVMEVTDQGWTPASGSG